MSDKVIVPLSEQETGERSFNGGIETRLAFNDHGTSLVEGTLVVLTPAYYGWQLVPAHAHTVVAGTLCHVGVVPQGGVADGAWCDVVVAGSTKCLVEGTTDVTTDDYLAVPGAAADYLVTNTTTWDDHTAAKAQEDQDSATPTLIGVWLLGDRIGFPGRT